MHRGCLLENLKKSDHLENTGLCGRIKECMIFITLKKKSVAFELLSSTKSITVFLTFKTKSTSTVYPEEVPFVSYINTDSSERAL